MGLTAYEALCIANDSSAIRKFRDVLDKEIEEQATNGVTYVIKYISWTVSDEAVEKLAEEYRARGFEVKVANREETKYYTCDQYSDRSFSVDFRNAKKEGEKCR